MIFRYALKYCHALLDSRKHEDVDRILLHVDYPIILRNLFRSPFGFTSPHDHLLHLIRGREIEALRILIPLLTDSEIPQRSDFMFAVNLAEMMENIEVETEIQIPLDIDLSPYIAKIAREPRMEYWRHASYAAVAYIKRSKPSAWTRPEAIHQFLKLCAAPTLFLNESEYFRTSDEIRTQAQVLLRRAYLFAFLRKPS